MRLQLTTTDLAGRSTSKCVTEMSKMIPNVPTFYWRRTLPSLFLASMETGNFLQESAIYFSELAVFMKLISYILTK